MDEKTKREERAEQKRLQQKDRSKFKKTDLKKRERQQQQERYELLKNKDLIRGRVLTIGAASISVQAEGKVYACRLKGSLKKERGKEKNLITVGDFVLFDEEGTIFLIEERTSWLSRQENLRRRQSQLIAANIDQVLITVSMYEPRLKPSLIDRYLIATEKGNMRPVLVINKVDLLQSKEECQEVVTTYESIGVPVVLISAHTGEGLEVLKKHMKDQASVFSGQSGVGKSSLINQITGLDIKTAEVSQKTEKGAHTTTNTHLIPLDCGGWCIDTPGIKSFGVWDLTFDDIQHHFSDLTAHVEVCKYRGCTHTHEPHCKVIQGVQEGVISPVRYRSYLRLIQDIT